MGTSPRRPPGASRLVVALSVVAVSTMAGACGTDPPTPTGPTSTAPPIWAGLACAPTPGVRVHSVQPAGLLAPVQLWLDTIIPPSGATVRPGDRYEVRYNYSSPPASTVVIHVHIGVSPGEAGFLSSGSGGCGSGGTGGVVPALTEQLRLHLRVWVEPRVLPPGEASRVFDRPPDYAISEPLPWTVRP